MFHVWAPSIDKLCSVLGVFCLCESLHCCHYRSRIWVSANFSPRLYIWYMYNYNLPLGHFSLAGAFLVPLERLLSCSSTDSAYSSTSSSSSSSITGWGKNLKEMNINYCQVFKMCKNNHSASLMVVYPASIKIPIKIQSSFISGVNSFSRYIW